METILNAFVELIKAVAWPATALILFFFLRKEVSALVTRLASLKVKDVEMSFLQEASQLRQAAQAALPPAEKHESEPVFRQYMEIARVDPRQAVIESWSRFITLIQDFAAASGFPQERGMTMPEIVMELKLRDAFDGKILMLLEDASKLGFRVQEGNAKPSYGEALEFCDAVSQLIVFFESVNREKKPANNRIESDEK